MKAAQSGTFAVKLCELSDIYGQLLRHIRIFQEESTNAAQIHRVLEQLLEECREQDRLLQWQVQHGCLRSAAKLARAQLQYKRQAESLLCHDMLREMAGRNATELEDRAEARTLFAEYAIDFATMTMRYALCASLQALELQAQAAEIRNAARQFEMPKG